MIDGIPPFPGVRVMPVGTRRYIAEVLEIAVTRIEVFADSPERAAQIVEGRDIRKEPTYFGHTSINIVSGETDVNQEESNDDGTNRQHDADDGPAGEWNCHSGCLDAPPRD